MLPTLDHMIAEVDANATARSIHVPSAGHLALGHGGLRNVQ